MKLTAAQITEMADTLCSFARTNAAGFVDGSQEYADATAATVAGYLDQLTGREWREVPLFTAEPLTAAQIKALTKAVSKLLADR